MFENLGAMVGSTGGVVQPGTGDVSQGTGFLGWMQQNPEQFAMILDQIGSQINPQNPLAGVGTSMAKSSLGNKAMASEQSEQQQFQQSLNDIMMGKTQMTPPGIPGISSATIKPGKDGGANEVTLSLTQGGQKPTGNSRLSQMDLSPSPF